ATDPRRTAAARVHGVAVGGVAGGRRDAGVRADRRFGARQLRGRYVPQDGRGSGERSCRRAAQRPLAPESRGGDYARRTTKPGHTQSTDKSVHAERTGTTCASSSPGATAASAKRPLGRWPPPVTAS